jgi:hypothetical protein
VTWLKDHWWWLLVIPVVGLALLAVCTGQLQAAGNLLSWVATEHKVVDAKREARDLATEHDDEIAAQKIEAKHAETLNDLDDHKREEMDRLRGDPAALSAALERAGRQKRRARLARERAG